MVLKMYYVCCVMTVVIHFSLQTLQLGKKSVGQVRARRLRTVDHWAHSLLFLCVVPAGGQH